MTQANNVLENLQPPTLEELAFFAEEVEDADQDEFLEDVSPEEDDGKPGKVRSNRRRAQTKKKHYTEDSIRLYLQEQITFLQGVEIVKRLYYNSGIA